MKNTRTQISDEQIKQARELLKTLPSKQKSSHSKRDAVFSMKKDIIALQARGYSFAEIAQQLQAAGISISPVTLKSYIQRGGGKKASAPVQTASTETAGDAPSAAGGFGQV
jgi:hypothetical protein